MKIGIKKENLPVISALVLPVVLILAVAVFAYFSNKGAGSAYDFLYVDAARPYPSYQNGQCITYSEYYEIDGSQLIERPGPVAVPEPGSAVPAAAPYCSGYTQVVKKDAPDLYLYNHSDGSSKEISYADATKLDLVDGQVSPDGYTVGGGYQSSGIFDIFGGGDSYAIYASTKEKSVRLSIPEGGMYNEDEFGFIAWVK